MPYLTTWRNRPGSLPVVLLQRTQAPGHADRLHARNGWLRYGVPTLEDMSETSTDTEDRVIVLRALSSVRKP